MPYMTYPEPWRGAPPKAPQHELFLQPRPKAVSSSSRYNGVTTTTPNGTRLCPPPSQPQSQRSIYKHPPSLAAPVNLTQPKDDVVSEELVYSPYSRMFTHPQFPPFSYLYQQQPYLLRPNFQPAPMSPLESYSPTTPTGNNTATFLSPPANYSPPSTSKTGQTVLREKRTPPIPQVQQNSLPPPSPSHTFKVPSGKEGSLKHRILTRPEDALSAPLDLQKPSTSDVGGSRSKRLSNVMSPPRSPKKPLNNNTVPGNFAKGSLIQLANGEMRRVEDMRTEDFITSAEKSPELRLAESTVVRISDNPHTGTATITLTYNDRRDQVEVESSLEHPYFVMRQGWASCLPERTLQCYGLKVHRLQVGDVLISLTPREPATSSAASTNSSLPSSRVSGGNTTIMTTATTTAMTVRPIPAAGSKQHFQHPQIDQQHHHSQQQHHHHLQQQSDQPINLHNATYHHQLSPDALLAARKRRWSAPDQICDENEQNAKRHN